MLSLFYLTNPIMQHLPRHPNTRNREKGKDKDDTTIVRVAMTDANSWSVASQC